MSVFGWFKKRAAEPVMIGEDEILLVAQQAVADQLKESFENAGIRFRSTGDAKVALATLKAYRPRAILVQKELDRGNGYSLLNAIRKWPPVKDVPLTFFGIKASDMEFLQHRGLATRADTYAIGPDGATLVSQLRKAMAGGKD